MLDMHLAYIWHLTAEDISLWSHPVYTVLVLVGEENGDHKLKPYSPIAAPGDSQPRPKCTSQQQQENCLLLLFQQG